MEKTGAAAEEKTKAALHKAERVKKKEIENAVKKALAEVEKPDAEPEKPDAEEKQ